MNKLDLKYSCFKQTKLLDVQKMKNGTRNMKNEK